MRKEESGLPLSSTSFSGVNPLPEILSGFEVCDIALTDYNGYDMATLQVTLFSRILGNEQRNVYHFAGGYAIVDNIQEIVDYLFLGYEDEDGLGPTMSDEWELYAASVKDVTDPENPTIPVIPTEGPIAGGNAADPLPLMNAALLQFTALVAPPNRSRKYLGGFTEGSHGPGGWGNTTLERIGFWADWCLDISTAVDAGIALVVSRINPSTGVLVGSNILESYSITPYARTQRRRTPGRGI